MPALVVEDTVTVAVQVNGKLRATLEVPSRTADDRLREAALADERVQQAPERRDPQGDRRAEQAGQLRRRLTAPERLDPHANAGASIEREAGPQRRSLIWGPSGL